MQIISADEAALLIKNDWVVIPGGFGCCGHPEAITEAIGRRFQTHGQPRNLTLFFAAGSGDRMGRGLDHLAHPDLVRRAIGGYWGFVPKLGALATDGEIEGHNWPQGVVSQLFRACAAGLPGVLSRVGLGTFIDPQRQGGRLNERSGDSLIRRVEIDKSTYLFFPTLRVDCAIIRGTECDEDGNLSMENEISLQDGLAQAQAARNSGGCVIAQVQKIVPVGTLHPKQVKVPGCLIDYVVLADTEHHQQTYAEAFNPTYVSSGEAVPLVRQMSKAREIIARRALEELRKYPGALVNVGIGIPAEIGQIARAEGYTNYNLTIESGQFGGVPASGMSFGAAVHPHAVIEQSSMFDFYDGGGIDVAFLGFAQVDSSGSVNVSHFPGRTPGVGGFANISSTAKRVVFCGTLTTDGLQVDVRDGRLHIGAEGRVRKFLHTLGKISFSGEIACRYRQPALYITERAVFELDRNCLRLIEVAPGINIDNDIIANIDSTIVVNSHVKQMSAAIFS
jgi:propionate CoA-transferase